MRRTYDGYAWVLRRQRAARGFLFTTRAAALQWRNKHVAAKQRKQWQLYSADVMP
jgi:hypothetical protein